MLRRIFRHDVFMKHPEELMLVINGRRPATAAPLPAAHPGHRVYWARLDQGPAIHSRRREARGAGAALGFGHTNRHLPAPDDAAATAAAATHERDRPFCRGMRHGRSRTAQRSAQPGVRPSISYALRSDTRPSCSRGLGGPRAAGSLRASSVRTAKRPSAGDFPGGPAQSEKGVFLDSSSGMPDCHIESMGTGQGVNAQGDERARMSPERTNPDQFERQTVSISR